jgi:hypothetical protein
MRLNNCVVPRLRNLLYRLGPALRRCKCDGQRMAGRDARFFCLRLAASGRKPVLKVRCRSPYRRCCCSVIAHSCDRFRFLSSVPPEIAKTLDPSVQELLGYSLTDYALGYASPTLLNDMPNPELIRHHDAAPLGSECV